MDRKKGLDSPFHIPRIKFLVTSENESDEDFCENCKRALELHDKGFPEAYHIHCLGKNRECLCSCRYWSR